MNSSIIYIDVFNSINRSFIDKPLCSFSSVFNIFLKFSVIHDLKCLNFHLYNYATMLKLTYSFHTAWGIFTYLGAQLCLTLCQAPLSMRILQSRILESGAISSSRYIHLI